MGLRVDLPIRKVVVLEANDDRLIFDKRTISSRRRAFGSAYHSPKVPSIR
jgi:hypothetical protein